MLRVITGKLKGRRLKAPKGINTRPTTDRVKESLFNIIGHIKEDSKILDLFSGTGNIGIEFISRGAKKSYFIDNDQQSIKVIMENIKTLNIEDSCNVYKNRVDHALGILGRKNITFNYVFMDPPYEKDLVLPTLDLINDNNLLDIDGTIIIEHESRLALPDEYKRYLKVDNRKYGDTTITFYKRKED